MQKIVIPDRINKVCRKVYWSFRSGLNSADRKGLKPLHLRQNVKKRGDDEYVYSYTGGMFVDQEWGYLISRNGYLFEESLEFDFQIGKAPWRIGLPSPMDFQRARDSRCTVLKIPKAIVLRHFWEWNYYHFYADVLGKLNLLFEAGIDRDIPIILGKYVNDVPFAPHVLKRGGLAKLNWIVPKEGEFIEVDEVIFCRTTQNKRDRLVPIVDLMGVQPLSSVDGDRIFLTRPQNAPRHIINHKEVEVMLHTHGFKTVDTTGIDTDSQIELFSNTRFLVAVHGAGIINMIFRKGCAMDVIELHPENYPTTDFREMASQFGYGWFELMCKATRGNPQHANIFVDVDALEAQLIKMLPEKELAMPHESKRWPMAR